MARSSSNKDQWDRIVREDDVEIQGSGYSYDGDWFQDIWDFNSGLYGADLIVWYGQPSIGDFLFRPGISSVFDQRRQLTVR
jgi:hypothetical protein